MSIASATSVASTRGELNDSPLGQLRAAHEALAQFVERLLVDLSRQSNPTATDPAADRQLAEMSARYEELERQLDAARAEAANRPAVSMELTSAQATLAESRKQNEVLRSQLATSRAAEEQLRSKLTQTQLEHGGLMAELHVLRYRSVELAEELSREKQHGIAERNLWNSELGQWRRLLESQLLRSQRTVSEGRAVAAQAPTLPAADAMLQSVLGDLQMLEHRPKSES